MGCIQSYFRKAAAGSSQASPVDGDRQIINFEQKSGNSEPFQEKVSAVPAEEPSPTNDDEEEADDENAEKGSLHCVEATAVRTLAASTGTVAILGTTAKYNEKVDYRKSYQDDASSPDEAKVEEKRAEDDQLEAAPEAAENSSDRLNEEPVEKGIAQNGPTSIVTTAIIEARSQPEFELEKSPVVENVQEQANFEKENESSKPEDTTESEKYLPKVVESIEKSKKESLDKKDTLSTDDTHQKPTLNQNQPKPVQEPTETLPFDHSVEPKKTPSPASTDTEDRDAVEHEKTNGNSEIESTSSDIISVVNELREMPPKKDSFDEFNKPNRLSFGQMSIEESEQNTLEISSADDVMKNESTDLTSPESLRESFEESFPKMNILVEGKAESKDDGESSKEENAREISNTSLNTLGDDSEDDGSDLDANFSRKAEHAGMRRFDTISSNGESSYNRVEDHNYPSVTEEPELEDIVDEKLLDLDFSQEDNVFDTEELKRLKKQVRENVIPEVDDICKQAVEKTTDIMAKIAAETAINVEIKDPEEVNNVSESSVLSAVDSVVAEKGSDFDSLSFLDEQSDSRSVSVLGQDDTKLPKTEAPEATSVASPATDDAQKRLSDWEQVSTETQEGSLNSSQEISGAVITQEDISLETEKTAVDSVSEDLPKPPDLEEFPPLPENLDQFDVTEDELKSVQLPPPSDNVQSDTKKLPDPELAASKIQAGVRGYLTRKQFKNRSNSQDNTSEPNDSKSDSGLGKDYNVQKKRMSLDSKLGDFENIRKLPKLRCTLSECVEEESESSDLDKAASKIQTTFRNYRARKSICLGENRKLLNGQSTIISKITEDAEKVENSSEPVNGNVETIKEKLVIEEDQTLSSDKPISTEQMGSNRMAVKTFEDDPLKQAAVKIQATYRGFKTRKSIQISASAATKIQAHFRGYKVRKSIKRSSSLNDLHDSASSSTSNLSTQPDLEKKVAKIQAGVRGYLVRKRHSLQNSAAAKIQINYRKYKSRKETKTRDPEQ